MSNVIIYHNPRCSKSRATLALIEQQGITPEIIKYLDVPPTAEQLEYVLTKLDYEPRQLMRRNEPIYKKLDLGNDKHSRQALIEAMLAHPVLIERPVVLANDKACIGRPPETVLDIL